MGVSAPTIKSSLRRDLLARRRTLSASERAMRSRRLCARLLDVLSVEELAAVVGYRALGAEVDPSEAIHALSRSAPAYAPTDDGSLGFRALESSDSLEGPGAGVVILVPGVAFDLSGVRLGRGSGWYDRLLPRYPDALKIGLAIEEQIVPELPMEPWDVPMNLVVTDRRALRSRPVRVAPRGIAT